ncbi:conserved exported hypothetical protein [uncultured Mycobacterium sp.]|uniref:Secreted protein n=1 Tax=uncultured Mycobacterium sp. TaxID=171292 RepID=A0A1Y5PAW4_9MYCO|nr:conserved exported hypothetical protein [uncultured Mycobacterium sp.]
MEHRRILAAAAAAVAVAVASIGAVGLAGPASATDDITQNAVGTYTIQYAWGPSTWVAVPCDGDVDQCLHITEFSAKDTKQKHPNWSANAYWSVGSWIIPPVDTPNALKCKEDGSKHDLPLNYSWDAATNSGSQSFFDPGICNGKTRSGSSPFTLTKIGPAPGISTPAQ